MAGSARRTAPREANPRAADQFEKSLPNTRSLNSSSAAIGLGGAAQLLGRASNQAVGHVRCSSGAPMLTTRLFIAATVLSITSACGGAGDDEDIATSDDSIISRVL